MAWKIEKAQQTRRAIRSICEVGGSLKSDHVEGSVTANTLATQPSGPASFFPNLADSAVGTMNIVDLRDTTATDDVLRAVATLTAVEHLYLQRTNISDTGLAYLQKLTHLTELNVEGTGVTDGGISSILRLSGLREIWLCESRITAEGVNRLQNALPNTVIHTCDPMR
jgi:hypothetical protein